MERRTLLAVVLSFVVLFVWSFFIQKNTKPAVRVSDTPAVVCSTVTVQNTGKELIAPIPVISSTKPVVPSKEQSVVVDTKNEIIVFTTRDAGVLSWKVKETKSGFDFVGDRTVFDSSITTDLPSFLGTQGLQFMFSSKTVTPSTSPAGVTAEIVFTSKVDNVTQITKKFMNSPVNGRWVLVYTITNSSPYIRELRLPVATLGPGLGFNGKNFADFDPYRAIAWVPDQGLKTVKDTKKSGTVFNQYGWYGLDNRYFMFILRPESKDNTGITTELGLNMVEPNKVPVLASYQKVSLPPKSQVVYSYEIYAQAKKYAEVSKLKHGLSSVIDFGPFGFLGKGMLWILNFNYGWTKNYGWAIIILTLLLQAIMLPLTLKSYESTIGMKKVQPLVDKLREQYKNDPTRLNTETMALYKQKKVNPLGGCLPMILQIPIFWALFTTLRNAYELRHAPFMFWITDLSLRDPYYILTILMGISMFLQQQLTMTSSDPQQKMMGYIFPVVFTFMFASFPAGLTLYWLISNIISVCTQVYLLRVGNKDTATA
ncbi:MAG: membrane protein insertase YidC [Elusimicrobiota bacterium]